MNKKLKNYKKMKDSFDKDIINKFNANKVKDKIKEYEEVLNKELDQKEKNSIIYNEYTNTLGANKNDKEFKSYFWDRNKEQLIKQVEEV